MLKTQQNPQAVGLVADRYKVIKSLGKGDSTEVFLVQDLIAEKSMVLKLAKDRGQKESFIPLNREFFYLSRFNHPNIIQVFDFGETEDKRPFFTMEYFPGIPINQFFLDGYSPELVQVMIQVLQALDVIHNQGLIHCDIKPQHILILKEKDGLRVKLLDFGFAGKVDLSSYESTPRGTLGYIAPEVFKGVAFDARADLYSLGLVIYEVITKKGPAGSEKDLRSWLRAQYYSNLPLPSELEIGKKTPKRFQDVIISLIQKDSDRRPRSALQVIESLITLLEPKTVSLPQVEKPQTYLLAPSFIGRQEFLDQLTLLLKSTQNGQGQVVLISGERGVGKSRLLQEFKFIAQLEGATVFNFTPASLGARTQSLTERILSIRNREQERETSLPKANSRRVEPEDELSRKYSHFEVITNQLRAFAQSEKVTNSLVLLIDDFEFFDSESFELLRYLALSIRDTPVRLLVIVCAVSEPRVLSLTEELKSKSGFTNFPLEPLDYNLTKQLVVSLLGNLSKLDELAEWLFNETGGNPLFIIETIYSLIESKILNLEARGWRLQGSLKDYKAPETAAELIRSRLRSLSEEELELLRIGACVGNPFNIEFLRGVTGYEPGRIYTLTARLKSIGLLKPVGIGTDDYLLSNKILEAVILEKIPVEKRRQNHLRIAQVLETIHRDSLEPVLFDLSFHYSRANVPEIAYEYALRAGKKAAEYLLNEQARQFYETALTLAPRTIPLEDRLNLLVVLGELREKTSQFEAAIDVYTQALSLALEIKEVVKEHSEIINVPLILRKIGLVYQKQDRHQDSLGFFDQARSMVKDKDLKLSVELLLDSGWSYLSLEDFANAKTLFEKSLDILEAKPEAVAIPKSETERLLARNLYFLSVLYWRSSEPKIAIELAEKSLKIFQDIQDQDNTSKVLQFLATLYWEQDLKKAKEYYEKSLVFYRKTQNLYFLLRSLEGLGLIGQAESDFKKAREYFEEAALLAQKIGDKDALGRCKCNLANILEIEGSWEQSLEYYQEDYQIAKKLNDRTGSIIAQLNIAQLLIKLGSLEEAQSYLSDAFKILEEDKGRNLTLLTELSMINTKLFLKMERYDTALANLAQGFKFAHSNKSLNNSQLISLYLLASELRLMTAEIGKSVFNAKKALSYSSGKRSREYGIALRLFGLGKRLSLENGNNELKESINLFRNLGYKYELGLSLLYSAYAILKSGFSDRWIVKKDRMSPVSNVLTPQELSDVTDNLNEAQQIFKTLGAKLDLKKTEELQENLSQTQTTLELKGRERSEYLKVFYQLSELINLGVDKEDFTSQLLDLIIDVTAAERGLLFLISGDRLLPAAARNVDHTTLEDALTISRTVIRRVKRRGEPILCADALTDPRFKSSESVILNKIRSLICVPLKLEDKVIGTIYLDSRVSAHLFLEEDKNLLISIANLLAATIDKSSVFKKLQEDFSTLREDILTDAVTGYFLGKSKAIKEVYKIIERIAPSDCTVLLLGETGSGKGVLARLIHSNSHRRANKFVSINCGTLPETLFESELFGHVKGAFTGAIRDKEGLFEIAEGGTIFMDEITNTTPGIQAKLLEVLEEKIIRRVGETDARRVDIRLICATNKDLKEEVKKGNFREDLFYRLNVVTIQVPPLRERKGDIPLLASYFIKRYGKQFNKTILGFEDDVIPVFLEYPWNGNVREMQNVIERAVIMTEKKRVSLQDLGGEFLILGQKLKENQKNMKPHIDREKIIEAMKVSRGNVTRAAQTLQTHRRQLQRLLKKYQIDRKSFESDEKPPLSI